MALLGLGIAAIGNYQSYKMLVWIGLGLIAISSYQSYGLQNIGMLQPKFGGQSTILS